ncbi:hypothetical protein [Desulfobotulus sp.]|uniref:hypothetical protein n=1 Tax=Desulfobotulus sp. TaxID=1940337 RepID=UPI002A370B19|nr:hypothetical protein [Desulfobotulus sp.]MDY0163112.1 hypothetical protein [Desulfobotulus sp.]
MRWPVFTEYRQGDPLRLHSLCPGCPAGILSGKRGSPRAGKGGSPGPETGCPCFLGGEDREYAGLVAVADASIPEAFIRRLGKPLFWRSSRAFFPLMQSVYGKAAAVGLDLCAGRMGEVREAE